MILIQIPPLLHLSLLVLLLAIYRATFNVTPAPAGDSSCQNSNLKDKQRNQADKGHLNPEKAKSFKVTEREIEQRNEELLIEAHFANL